jgi:alkanesulfonate monooxygenase SsuD/methylene tetrahydromethanopterin reductase-like flavin-dependent oxidoreductase (luciferase family)
VHILKKMWAEPVFDFDGKYYQLRANRNEPKPIQRPGPPLLLGGWGKRTLRLVAEHADIWNIPGPPHNNVDYVAERSQVLDEQCAAVGRDPREIARSVQTVISYDDAGAIRKTVQDLIGVGVNHVVLSLPRGYPQGIGQWLVDEVIKPVREELPD